MVLCRNTPALRQLSKKEVWFRARHREATTFETSSKYKEIFATVNMSTFFLPIHNIIPFAFSFFKCASPFPMYVVP